MITKLDPGSILPPSAGRQILNAAQSQNLDSNPCQLLNDTSDTFIVAMMHDDHYVAQLWGQPPGSGVTIPPSWKVVIWPCNNNNAIVGDADGNVLQYGGGWGLTTEDGRVFHFSTMS